MYDLGIILFFTIYSFFRLLEEGLSYTLIIISLMTHLFIFIILQINYNHSKNSKLFAMYSIVLLGSSLIVHPLLGFMAFIIIVLKYPLKIISNFTVCGLSLIHYSIYYEGLSYVVISIHIGVLLGGYCWYKNNEEINNLRDKIDQLRDTTKDYRTRVEQLNLYNDQLEYTTKIIERNQIAQVLHDKLGHTLAGNIMRLEVSKMLVDTDKEKAKSLIGEIATDLRDGMDQVRDVLKELKPTQSELGVHTIKEMLKELEPTMSVKTNLYYEGDLTQISYIIWKVIIDNLTEAITNLKKYSNGDTFDVQLYQFNKILKVEIKDNGTVPQVLHKGLGLRGMEERVIESGGNIRYNMNEGFSIIMIWVGKDDKSIDSR